MSSTGRIEAGRPPVTCDCDPCPVTTLIIALARVAEGPCRPCLRAMSPDGRCAKRNQRGEANDSWRGDAAGYAALHLRVASARGKPSFCERCGATEGKFEWANLTGNYVDVEDYARMCVSCHRRYDAARRRETGRRTMPEGM